MGVKYSGVDVFDALVDGEAVVFSVDDAQRHAHAKCQCDAVVHELCDCPAHPQLVGHAIHVSVDDGVSVDSTNTDADADHDADAKAAGHIFATDVGIGN